MTYTAWGLIIGMVGVAMLFKWGPPQPDFSEDVGLALEPSTVLADGTKISDLAQSARRRKRLHQRLSKLALALIFVGFALQLVDAVR